MLRIKQIGVSSLLVMALFISLIGTTWAAEPSSHDITSHWAEKELNEWINSGYLSGYQDGTYRPNDTISRGELMALINRAFTLKETADITFTDLKESNWAYEQAAIAVQAGYVTGYEDGTIRAGNKISREEAASMIAKLLSLKLDAVNSLEQFSDTTDIAEWSKPAVSALLSQGIITGYPDGSYRPKGSITRAESVIALARALQANLANKTFNNAGTYGPATGTETIKGNVVINTSGVILQNLIIEGNLTLAAGIGEGDVFLNNIKVTGTTTVAGGGENSIHVKDSVLVHIIVNKRDGSVRIVAEGATSVQSVTVQSSVKIEEDHATGTGFTNIKLAQELPQGSRVQLLGQFESVDIDAKSIRLEIPTGSINQLNVNEQAGQIDMNLSQQAKIIKLVLDAAIKLTGQGTIENAIINENAKSSSFETPPVKSEGTGAPTPTPPNNSSGTTVGGGGSTGGGTITPQPTVNQYGLTVPSQVHVTGTATMLNVTANNQLIDNNGVTISDIYYFQDKPYFVPTFSVTQNNGQHYSGNVRITASTLTASQGASADDIQLFAYHDGSSAHWADILKTGFGSAQGSTIDTLMQQLNTANKWYVVAKSGVYTFRIQVEDVATGSIIAQSSTITVTSENLNLSQLNIGNYELTQLDTHGIGVIGTGFDPNIYHYQTHIANNVNQVALNLTSAAGTTIEVRQINPSIPGETNSTLITQVDGTYNISIPAGVIPSVKITVKTEQSAKEYNLVIFRFKDLVGDPSQFDSTDIQMVDSNSFMLSGIEPSVTVSVYDAEVGGNLLESKQMPISSSPNVSILVSISNLGAQAQNGTLWFSIDESSPRVAKAYNATPVTVIANPTGLTVSALTSDEIAEAQKYGYSYATTGFKLLLNHSSLPTEIQNFAYYTYSWSNQSSTSNRSYDEVKPTERGSMVAKGSIGETIHHFYASESGNYYRIVFFDQNDLAVGFVEVLDTPTP
ncbi:S-layer homology domain-containing protein [Paenibacillus amylolyticus]|uniref:S-layer homology domain-containing protein n=1 Tax=Paenibacillus amylolyticus TaxID=1451 RepID=UPI003EBB627B